MVRAKEGFIQVHMRCTLERPGVPIGSWIDRVYGTGSRNRHADRRAHHRDTADRAITYSAVRIRFVMATHHALRNLFETSRTDQNRLGFSPVPGRRLTSVIHPTDPYRNSLVPPGYNPGESGLPAAGPLTATSTLD